MRRLMLLLVLLGAGLTTAPIRADDAPTAAPPTDPAPLLKRAKAYVAEERYRKALPLFEQAFELEGTTPTDRIDGCNCAFKAAMYLRAEKLVKDCVKVVRKIRPVTDDTRMWIARLRKIAKEAKFERNLRDKQIPKIVHDIVKYLNNYQMLDRCKYVKEVGLDEYVSGKNIRKLDSDYKGPHLYVHLERAEPDWDPVVAMYESYADKDRANKRFEALAKLIKGFDKRWGADIKGDLEAKSVKLAFVKGGTVAHLVEGNWEMRRINLKFRVKGGPELLTNNFGSLVMLRRVPKGKKKPAPETWYELRLVLNGRWFYL